MHTTIMILLATLRETFLSRTSLHLENLALRQQVAVLKRERRRPWFQTLDRLFWVILSRLWPRWREALVIVRPETVIGWHRKGFRAFWTWKSRRAKPGRPPVHKDVRELIRRMCWENPLWGAPRIHGELMKLGIEASEATVSRYMVRHRKPPSQTWRTFLDNHVGCLVSTDFFVVPTATFAVLFVFIVACATNGGASSTSVLQHTRPQRGWRSRSAKPFRGTRRHGTSFVIGTGRTVGSFGRG